MAVTVFYIDGDNGNDANSGISISVPFDNAKKTVWEAIVECVENDTALGDGITFEISGGTTGITYPEIHNLYLSEIAANYTGDTPSISTTTGMPNGTVGKPVTITGSTEAGHNGEVTINASTITNFLIYDGVITTRLDYSIISNLRMTGALNTKEDVFLQSGSDNSIVEDMYLDAFGSHGIYLKNSDNSTVRRCRVHANMSVSTSSGIKIGDAGTSINSTIHHNEVLGAGGSGSLVHFGIQFDGGTGHKCYNNIVTSSTGIGIGCKVVTTIAEMYNNMSYSNTKHAFSMLTGTTITAADNNNWHKADNEVCGVFSAFSTAPATYDDNSTDYTISEWQTLLTDEASSINTIPNLAGINSSMPRPESNQYEAGDNTVLASESITTDILGAAIDSTPNMGAYQTRYYMPTEQAKPAINQPFYKGHFVLPVIIG